MKRLTLGSNHGSKRGPEVRGKPTISPRNISRGPFDATQPPALEQGRKIAKDLEDKMKEALEKFGKQEKNIMELKDELKQVAEKNSMELKELKQVVEDGFDGLKQLMNQFSGLQASMPPPPSSSSSGVPPVTRASPQNTMASANDAVVAAAMEQMNDAMSAVSSAELDGGSTVGACLNVLVGTLELFESFPVVGALATAAAKLGTFMAGTYAKHADIRALLATLLCALSFLGLLMGILNECRDDGDKAKAKSLVDGVSASLEALLAEVVAYSEQSFFKTLCSAATKKPDRILKASGTVMNRLDKTRDWVSALGQKNILRSLNGLQLPPVPVAYLPLAQAAVDMHGGSTPGSAAEAEALVEVGLAGGVSLEDLSAGMAELGCSNARAEEALAGYGEALTVQLGELMRVNQGLVEGQLEMMGALHILGEKQEVAIGKIDDMHEDQKEGQLEMMDKIKDMKGDQKAMYEGMLAAIEKQSRVLEGQVKEQTRFLAEQLKLENAKDSSKAAENVSLKKQLTQKEVDLAAIAAAAASVRGGDASAAAASLAASGASAEVKNSFEAVLAQAAAARDAEDYVKGAELFGKACKMDPSSISAWFGSGYCLDEVGDKAGAEESWRKVIELDPKYALAHYNLGVVLRDKGNLAGAEECYRKAIEHDPKNALAHFNLGNLLLSDKGDLAGAEECFRKAIEHDPKKVSAHFNLGVLLKDTGNLAGAEECYRKALELDPKKVSAHGNLGSVLKAKADALEASGGDGKAVAALLLEVAEHWEVQYGAQHNAVVAARRKAAKLK